MAKAAKTPVKVGGGPVGQGPKTPKMKPQHTPKPKPHTPGLKNGTPAKTPKKTPKPQPDTPMPPRQTPKTAPPTPKAQQPTPKAQHQTPKAQQPTPKVQQPTPKMQQPTPKQKQKSQQQKKQINPPSAKGQQKSPKEQMRKLTGPGSKPGRDAQARTVRLTFPAGTLQSVEQVKQLVPTATAVKFPNVVFVEFAAEAEAEKQHARLQPLIADGQLQQVNFVGEKEREFQSNNRGVDNTRLFIRGIGNATEADIKKLFPTAMAVAVRGTNRAARGSSHPHKFAFVEFATAAACTEALEKSKGLTLFGNPLTVNYAFLRKNPGGEVAKAEKRPAEAAAAAPAAAAPAKKAKIEPKLEEEEDDDDEDDEDEVDGKEEDDDGEEEEDDDDDEGDEDEDDEDGDEDDEDDEDDDEDEDDDDEDDDDDDDDE